jgi:hypothetical protein
LRWLEGTENYLYELKVKRWRKEVNSREEGVSVINEAKVLRGP